jgi:hypothetical protein
MYIDKPHILAEAAKIGFLRLKDQVPFKLEK